MIAHDWVVMVAVLAVLGILLVGLHVYQHRAQPQPETVRKLVHIGMGLTALSFPWLFSSPVPVFVLALVSIALLWSLRHFSSMQRRFGDVLGGVQRTSFGELYFPAGIAILFWLSHGDPLLYSIPLLILTLADAVAALIGLRYGKALYATADGTKSVEGSFAFFMMAFLSTLVPLQLFSDVGRAQTLLISLIIGILIMLLEAIAWRGLDNLSIPVIGVLLLNTFLRLSTPELLTNFLVITVISILSFTFRKRGSLDDNALLAAVVISYVMWALGGWLWLYPPAILFFRDRLQTFRSHNALAQRHNVLSIMTICAPGLLCLVAFRITGEALLFYPYVLTFAAHLAIFEITRFLHHTPAAGLALPAAFSIFVGWFLMFAPFVLLLHFSHAGMLLSAAAIVPVALAALVFARLQPNIEDCPRDMPRWLRQAAGALLAAVMGSAAILWQAMHA